MTVHHAIRHVQHNLSQVSFSFIKPCLHDATKLVKLRGKTSWRNFYLSCKLCLYDATSWYNFHPTWKKCCV